MVTKLFSHRIKQLFNVITGAAVNFAVSIYGVGTKKYNNWVVSIVLQSTKIIYISLQIIALRLVSVGRLYVYVLFLLPSLYEIGVCGFAFVYLWTVPTESH